MKKGEATGPQKAPRAGSATRAEAKHAEALGGASEGSEEADPPLNPDAIVTPVEDGHANRRAWDNTVERIELEGQRLMDALRHIPGGSQARVAKEIPLGSLQEVEAKLTQCRVFLEQTGDTVR